MSIEKVHVEVVKGINGLDKVVLREIRGSSAEVILFYFYNYFFKFFNLLLLLFNCVDCICSDLIRIVSMI